MFQIIKKNLLNAFADADTPKSKTTTRHSKLDENKTENVITYYKLKLFKKSILNRVLKNNAFKYDNQKYDLYMPGYADVRYELNNVDLSYCKYIFGFIECNQIIRKNNLWTILEKKYGRHNAKQIMPESFIIGNPRQYKTALKKINGGTTLICKKNLQRKLGLALTFTENDLIKAKNDNFKVAQIFLTNTMQIQGRKMNMRIYYVIRKYKEHIQFFVNTKGKVLYTKNKTGKNITFDTHITSQMDVTLYEKENIPHDFEELKKFIGKEKYMRIWAKIINNITHLSKAIAPLFNEVTFYDKVCFQLFGMDVILENDHPYILEINKGPDMSAKCNKDIMLKENIYESTFQVAGLLTRSKPSNYIKVYETNIPYISVK
jgi:hypothetical protein